MLLGRLPSRKEASERAKKKERKGEVYKRKKKGSGPCQTPFFVFFFYGYVLLGDAVSPARRSVQNTKDRKHDACVCVRMYI